MVLYIAIWADRMKKNGPVKIFAAPDFKLYARLA